MKRIDRLKTMDTNEFAKEVMRQTEQEVFCSTCPDMFGFNEQKCDECYAGWLEKNE